MRLLLRKNRVWNQDINVLRTDEMIIVCKLKALACINLCSWKIMPNFGGLKEYVFLIVSVSQDFEYGRTEPTAEYQKLSMKVSGYLNVKASAEKINVHLCILLMELLCSQLSGWSSQFITASLILLCSKECHDSFLC